MSSVPLPRRAPASTLAMALLVVAVAVGCNDDPIGARVVELEVTPAALTFARVPIGVVDESIVLVTNRGNAPWVPDGPPAVVGDGFRHVSGCDLPVGPDEVCELRVAFAPIVEGPASGSARVVAIGVGALGQDIDIVVPLAGEGAPPVLTLDPPAIDFGAVAVGDFRVDVVTATNVGDGELVFDVEATPDAFRVAGDTITTVRLGPGETRELNVTFVPTTGGPAAGRVLARLCGPGCGPAVTVVGSGAAPRIDAAPRSIDFGGVAIGAVAEAPLTLTNTGTGTLRIDDLEVLAASTDVTVAPVDLPILLEDGASVDVTLRYAPTTGRAALDAMLLIHSTDPLSPEVFIPVDGLTNGPGLVMVPGVAHFGRLEEGASRDLTVVVRSTGTVDLDAVALSIEGPGFSLPFPSPPTPLPAGEALAFSVRATADAGVVLAGGATGRLVATATGVTATTSLAVLAGSSGCVPVAPVAHTNLGIVPVRSGSRGAVVIENVGDAPCILAGFEPGGGGLGFDVDFSAAPQGLASLLPGESGRVQFAFLASRAGPRTGVVELRFADVDAPLFVSASATAVEGSLATQPPTVALGPTAVGCDDPIGNSSIVNTGPNGLEVTSVTLNPPGAPFVVDVGALPFRLLPGASRAISVRGLTAAVPPGLSEVTVTFATAVGISADLRVSLEVVPETEPVEEQFTASPVSAVDILFIVDNSGSMFDDQELLAANFATFFESGLIGGAPSFQVGVTTTDVLSPDAARGTLVGTPPVLTASTPGLAEAFADRVRVGTEGTGLELGLEALRLALEAADTTRFVRPDAALSVIFVTDEEDTGAFPDLLPDASLSRSPADYIAFLEARKAGTVGNAPILVSGVVLPGAATRYEALVEHFGGSVLDIQTPDWGQRLSDVGNDTFALGRSFQLENEPAAGSIVVEVDGVVTSDFAFVADRRAVVLDDTPPSGANVEIRYRSGCR